jgi:CDGSH-type Zn-finger protein
MHPPSERACRITIDPGGPLVLQGPVEVSLDDGTVARSERPTVAVCTCRRSRRYPWCDTSHRRRSGRSGTGRDVA